MAHRAAFELHKHLKRLDFKGCYGDFERMHINGLVQLEQLKIEFDEAAQEQCTLDLPNLKVLEIGDRRPDWLKLLTPKLKKLKCGKISGIQFEHLNTIYVETSDLFFRFGVYVQPFTLR